MKNFLLIVGKPCNLLLLSPSWAQWTYFWWLWAILFLFLTRKDSELWHFLKHLAAVLVATTNLFIFPQISVTYVRQVYCYKKRAAKSLRDTDQMRKNKGNPTNVKKENPMAVTCISVKSEFRKKWIKWGSGRNFIVINIRIPYKEYMHEPINTVCHQSCIWKESRGEPSSQKHLQHMTKQLINK